MGAGRLHKYELTVVMAVAFIFRLLRQAVKISVLKKC